MEAIEKFWSRTMEIREARWFLAFVGLVIGLIVAYYFIMLFRNMAFGKSDNPTNHIADFKQLRDEGKLDEEEYAKLSKVIPKPTLPEFNDKETNSD